MADSLFIQTSSVDIMMQSRFESGSLADFALGGSPSGGAVVLNSTTWWPLVSLRSLLSDNLFEDVKKL